VMRCWRWEFEVSWILRLLRVTIAWSPQRNTEGIFQTRLDILMVAWWQLEGQQIFIKTLLLDLSFFVDNRICRFAQ